jgi:hypothetical protein
MLYPNFTGMIFVSILLTKRRNPPKFLLLFLSANWIMWRKCLSSLFLLKKKKKKKKRGNGIFP